ncbi:hypothetical protein B0H63DRAFT_506354 [Podospora didyma]|uniref:Uncharacterized protein n=1 Tax=Podospora didyma TaxID=330526 RepID=A0AAE0U8A9_9PEZI|nr:hypothetical protein B0H63DRAFT_506354 [Podospora didyma]
MEAPRKTSSRRIMNMFATLNIKKDVISIATGAAAVLGQLIQLFDQTKKAVNSPNHLRDVIENYSCEISGVKGLLNRIAANPSLPTESIGKAAEDVKGVGEDLKAALEKVKKRPETSSSKQILKAFFSKPVNDEEMRNIMNRLVNAKLTLITNLSLAGMKLTEGLGNSLEVYTAVTLDRTNITTTQDVTGNNVRPVGLANGTLITTSKVKVMKKDYAADLTVPVAAKRVHHAPRSAELPAGGCEENDKATIQDKKDESQQETNFPGNVTTTFNQLLHVHCHPFHRTPMTFARHG